MYKHNHNNKHVNEGQRGKPIEELEVERVGEAHGKGRHPSMVGSGREKTMTLCWLGQKKGQPRELGKVENQEGGTEHGDVAWLAAFATAAAGDHGRRRLGAGVVRGVRPWLLEGVSRGSNGGHGARALGLREKKGYGLG